MAGKKKEAVPLSPQEERRKILEARSKAWGIQSVKPKIGDDLAVKGNVKFVPTGIKEIDNIIGKIAGIAEGTMVEFAGENASGKTYVAMCLAAQAQKQGKRVMWCDVEYSFSEERARQCGMDTRNPDLFEFYEGLGPAENWGEWILNSTRTGEYGLIVVDSVTAMIPSANFVRQMNQGRKVGAHALFMSDWTQKQLQAVGDSGNITVLINQLRNASGTMPNTFTKKSTGGESIGFYCSQRLWFAKVNGKARFVMGAGNKRVGARSKILVVKSRYGGEDNTGDFSIYFGAAEGNPINDFLHRVLNSPDNRKKEYVTYTKTKGYRYVDTSTGVLHAASEDAKEFLEMLMSAEPPSVRTRGDNSETAFEYWVGRLKYSEQQVADLGEALTVEYGTHDSVAVVEADEGAEEDVDMEIVDGEEVIDETYEDVYGEE